MSASHDNHIHDNLTSYTTEPTQEAIIALLKTCLPGSNTEFEIVNITPGERFNNRIYRISVTVGTSERDRSYILKVNGRRFGPGKVENEVACLLLVQQMCPKLPVPRAIAWSEDGSKWHRTGADMMQVTTSTPESDISGWILMTCMPGEPLDISTLSKEDQLLLCSQVADIMTSWKENIPCPSICGNLHFKPYKLDTQELSTYLDGKVVGNTLHIYGSLDDGNENCPPLFSTLEFWKTRLLFQIQQMGSSSTFAPSYNALSNALNDFIEQTLPRLPSLDERHFVFTHADLFQRNILVSGESPTQITGIVDFEISGFAPPMEEYVQTWQSNDEITDWPPEIYEMILEELEKRGQVTPRHIGEVERRVIKGLSDLRNFITPYWLVEREEEDPEGVKKALELARNKVRSALIELQGLIDSGIDV